MYLRKKLKRVLALVLVFCLSASLVSVPAYAVEEEGSGRTLICGETEHTHGPECYGEPVLVCGQEESDGHTHTEECYGEEVKELTCGKEETAGHTHTDECYTVSDTPTCGLEETEGHKHSADCRTLICGKSASTDVDDPNYHQHDDSCWEYSCGGVETEGHTHTEACYGKELTCGQEEAEAHTHTDECYTVTRPLTCGQDEGGHTHSDACYERPLICEIPEHTHTEACYAAETVEPEIDEAAQAVIDQFNALTEDDINGYSEAYTTARDAYFALSEEEQAQVKEILGEENVRAILLGEAMNAAINYDEWSGEHDLGNGEIKLTRPIVIKGTATIKNGTIDANKTGSAIIVLGGTLTLDGVTIKNGTGTLLHMTGVTEYRQDSKGNQVVFRSNWEIGNTGISIDDSYLRNSFYGLELQDKTCGGGILVITDENNKVANLVIQGNTVIDGNSAYMGGGICALPNSNVKIYGGKIQNNSSTGQSGGGMFLAGKGNVINPINSDIYIQNNHKTAGNDLGGGGIFVNNNGDLTIQNAVIHDNHANGLGGGVAGCIHGTVSVSSDGAAIYNNTADGTTRLHSVVDRSDTWSHWGDLVGHGDDYFVAGHSKVGSRSLGMGTTRWEGKAIYSSGAQGQTVSSTGSDPIVVADGLLALSVENDAEIKSAADNVNGHKVIITGNTSNTHGGGIGTNGLVVFGDGGDLNGSGLNYASFSVVGTKKVEGGENLAGYKFELKDAGGNVIGTAISDNAGKITFQNVSTKTLFGETKEEWSNSRTATLTLSEAAGTDSNMIYDTRVYTITVTAIRKGATYSNTVGNYTYTFTQYADTITNVTVNGGTYRNGILSLPGNTFVNTQKYDLTLTLVKLAKIGNFETTMPIQGAEFKLVKLVDGKYVDVGTKTYTTDDEGKLTAETITGVTPDELDDYYFVETKAPEGSVLDETPVKPGTVQKVQTDATATGQATKYNAGNFELNIVKYDPEKGADYKTQKMGGATFTLVYHDKTKGDYTVGTNYKTTADGKLKIAGLVPGSYTLTETAAPEGFVLPSAGHNSVDFTVDKDGKVTTGTITLENAKLVDGKLLIGNDQAHGNLALTKRVQKDTTNGTSGAGKTYTFRITGTDVYGDSVNLRKKAGLSVSGSPSIKIGFEDNGFTAVVTVGEDETATLTHLPYGNYTITEDKTSIDDVKYYYFNGVSYSVKADGVDVPVGDPDGKTVEVEATNEYRIYKASLKIGKRIVANGAPMNEDNKKFFENQEFTFTLSLLRAADGVASWQERTFTLKPGQTETINGLPIGTYKLVETGYTVDNYDFDYVAGSSSLVTRGGKGVMFIEITGQSNGNTVWFDACNNYNVKTGDIVIHKDASMDGTLYGEEGEHIVEQFHFFLDGTDLNGNKVHRDLWVDYSDEAKFENVPYGTYTITEDMKAAGVDNYEFGGVTFKNGDTTQRFDADGVGKEGWGFQVTLDDDNNSSNVELKLDVTNEYTRKLDSMSVQKIISGNSMDYSAKYDFTIAFKVPASYVKLAGAYPYDVYDAQGSVIRSSSIQKVQSEKTFEAAGGTPVTGGGVSVIGDKTVEVDGEYYTVYGTIEGLGNGEKAVVSKLPVGVKWHVVEVKENQGYSTNYDHQNGVVTENAENSVTVTNSSSVYTTVNVQKVWVGDEANRRPVSITVQLFRNGEPMEGKTAVLNADNGWRTSWNSLPYGSRYSVSEVGSYPGYTATVTGDGSGTTVNITLTNTYDERSDNTRLRVNKIWEGDDPFTRPNEITVQLLRNGQPNGTVTLSESNNWTYEWTGLDASATYDVEEVAIPAGYTSSKTVNGRTYTIYNTYDTTIPDEDIPLADLPENDIPLADLPDDDIPLAEIPDDEIPLDEAPQTGDNSRKGLLLALAICSAFGMAITGKLLKTKEEDQGDGEN